MPDTKRRRPDHARRRGGRIPRVINGVKITGPPYSQRERKLIRAWRKQGTGNVLVGLETPIPTPLDPLGPVGPALGGPDVDLDPLPGDGSLGTPGDIDAGDIPLVGPAIETGGDALAAFATFVTDWLLHPERLLKVILGAILLILGASRLTKEMTGAGIGDGVRKVGGAMLLRKV